MGYISQKLHKKFKRRFHDTLLHLSIRISSITKGPCILEAEKNYDQKLPGNDYSSVGIYWGIHCFIMLGKYQTGFHKTLISRQSLNVLMT